MNLTLNISVHPGVAGAAVDVITVSNPPPLAAAAPHPKFTKLDDGFYRRNSDGALYSRTLACGSVPQKEAARQAATLAQLPGYTPWELAECDDLLTMVDRTRFNPACDPVFDGDCKSDWYWSRTPDVSDPEGCAWLINFYYGNSYIYGRYYYGFARAVCRPVARAGQ